MTALRRLTVLLGACAAIPAGVMGCGSSDIEAVPLAQAAQTTKQARLARVDGRVRVTGAGLPQPLTLTMRGTSALDRAEMDVTFDLRSLAGLLGLPASQAKARLVTTGGRVFLQVPRQLRSLVPRGRAWVAAELAPVARAMGFDPETLAPLMRLDPGRQLDLLRAKGRLRRVGTEEIGGEQTIHYRGSIRMADAVALVPAGKRAKLRREIEKLSALAGGDPPTPFDVWIDGEGYMRRWVGDVRMPAQAGQPAGRVRMTMTLSDFGGPSAIEPPAAGQVSDVTDAIVPHLRRAARTAAGPRRSA